MFQKSGGNNLKAVYAGSFDPYTNGHKDIIRKASKLFDELHIIIGINKSKTRKFVPQEMAKAIELDLANEGITNCKVVVFCGVIALYCKENDIKYTVRGLRNNMDYNYEENISEVNKLINPELETVYLRADVKAISSSMVKELLSYDQDIMSFVPPSVLELVEKERYGV